MIAKVSRHFDLPNFPQFSEPKVPDADFLGSSESTAELQSHVTLFLKSMPWNPRFSLRRIKVVPHGLINWVCGS